MGEDAHRAWTCQPGSWGCDSVSIMRHLPCDRAGRSVSAWTRLKAAMLAVLGAVAA